jgi:hypothetical protein
MLSGTEANIVKSISRLGQATKGQISREMRISTDYVELLCRYLVRKGYLICAKGCYSLAHDATEKHEVVHGSLAKDATEKLPPVVTPHIDRKLKYLEYFEKAYQRLKKQINESLKVRR